MTTVKEIDKLNEDLETYFPPNLMDIDIGDYTFTEVRQLDQEGFLYLYSNPEEPNVKLLFNEDRMAIIRYILRDDEMVETTSWRMGKTFHKKFSKEELNHIF